MLHSTLYTTSLKVTVLNVRGGLAEILICGRSVGRIMSKKGNDTKARILALERILMGAQKPLKCDEIIDKLNKQYHIYANRKTIYDDIAVLTCFVNVKHWRHDGYWAEKGE